MSGTAGKKHPGGSKRRAARLAAVQALYEIAMTGAKADAVLMEFMAHRWRDSAGEPMTEPDSGLFTRIVRGVLERAADLDSMIGGALEGGWTVERLELVLASILRAGVYELLACADVPAPVVITEYVDVAHAFFAGGEPSMVNGVLDRLARSLRPEDMRRDPAAPQAAG